MRCGEVISVNSPTQVVIPAQAGIQIHRKRPWIPACAGMTDYLRTYFLFVIFLLGIITQGFANSGASFLKLGVGARALGLGSAYTAIANDVTALYWNPAGLAGLNKKELSAMHAQLFADTQYEFLGYAHPIKGDTKPQVQGSNSDGWETEQKRVGGQWTLGAGAVYLTQGAIEGRAEDRTIAQDFTASDLAVVLGLARKNISQNLPISLGANLKLLQSKIANYNATGFAMDMGAMTQVSGLLSHPISLGIALQNVGPQMTFLNEGSNLPLALSGGAGYQFFKSFLVSADLKYQPYDSRTSMSLGTEFSPMSFFTLRAGYLTNAVRAVSGSNGGSFSDSVSDLSGLGMGIGLKIGMGTLDYSFTPAGELGNTQRISLSVKF